MKFLAE